MESINDPCVRTSKAFALVAKSSAFITISSSCSALFFVQNDESCRERCEALEVAEAYRLALEQQMERGRNLAHQLVVMATKTDLVHSPTAGEDG